MFGVIWQVRQCHLNSAVELMSKFPSFSKLLTKPISSNMRGQASCVTPWYFFEIHVLGPNQQSFDNFVSSGVLFTNASTPADNRLAQNLQHNWKFLTHLK